MRHMLDCRLSPLLCYCGQVVHIIKQCKSMLGKGWQCFVTVMVL